MHLHRSGPNSDQQIVAQIRESNLENIGDLLNARQKTFEAAIESERRLGLWSKLNNRHGHDIGLNSSESPPFSIPSLEDQTDNDYVSGYQSQKNPTTIAVSAPRLNAM